MVLVLKKGASEGEMQAIKDAMHATVSKHAKIKSKKVVNIKQYAGSIVLKEDPLVIQNKLRHE